MAKFESTTESFESKLVENIAIVRLKGKALDIVTEPASSHFYELLESIKDSPELLGYVQINDSEFDSHGAVERMVQLISKDDSYYKLSSRQYGLLVDVIAARFRHSIGRILLAAIGSEKPMIAGLQGKISGEYLGITLAFDSRIATADTIFSFDNVRTGIPGSPGLTYLMPRYIGIGRAMSLIQRGLTIDAQEAHELGLISDIVDNIEDLTDRCVREIQDMTKHMSYLVKLHRQQVLPTPDEIRSALERYYKAAANSVMKLRGGR